MADAIPEAVIIETFGPFVTSISLQMIFLGVLIAQIYDYYRMFPNDPMWNKVLVTALTVVTVFQGVMDYKILYRCTVQYYGNFDKFDDTDWTLWTEIVVTAIIGSIAQSFFLERCYRATKSRFVAALGILGILTSLGSGTASTITFAGVKRLSLVPEIPIPITMWLVVTAVVDVYIAGVLIWSLIKVKSSFRKTESIVGKLVRLTMETSALTACVAIVNLVLYLALPGQAWHLIPQMNMGKMYGLSVMVTLSSRKDLRNVMNASDHASYIESRASVTHKLGFTSQTGSAPGGRTLIQGGGAVSGIKVTTTYHEEGNGSESDIKNNVEDIEMGAAQHPVAMAGQEPTSYWEGDQKAGRPFAT